MHRIYAHLHNDREENRRHDDNGGIGLHEGADNQQHDVYKKQQHDGIAGNAEKNLRYLSGNGLACQNQTKCRGRGNDQHYQGRADCGFF